MNKSKRIEIMTNEQKQKLDYRKEYYEKYYAEKRLNNKNKK